MGDLTRLGLSINTDLLERFDKLIDKKGYANRSEAFRDLIRDFIIETEWQADDEAVGVVSIVYDHHTRELSDKILNLQHEYTGMVNSTLHVHLDHYNCLEAIVVKGRSSEIEKFADKLIATKGVKHGKLTKATTGKDI